MAWADNMIECVCDIAEREESGQHITSHYLFIAKVLGEPRIDALPMAAASRHVKLTPAACHSVLEGWSS